MLTQEQANLVAALCGRLAGLKVDPRKLYPIESRLAPVARREGADSVTHLLSKLKTPDERLVWGVVEAMAQAETSFFRDKLPFDQFAEFILPRLAARANDRPVSVWSAGCATGQEAYSLLMAAEQADVAIDLLATDLSEPSLRRAQKGLYSQFEIQRGLPARMLVNHFHRDGEAWQISDRLRQMVRWRRVNLIGDLSSLPQFDVIFCRNLLTGLEEPAARKVLASLAGRLSHDGVLVLGLKDAVQGDSGLRPVAGRPGLYQSDAAERDAA